MLGRLFCVGVCSDNILYEYLCPVAFEDSVQALKAWMQTILFILKELSNRYFIACVLKLFGLEINVSYFF